MHNDDTCFVPHPTFNESSSHPSNRKANLDVKVDTSAVKLRRQESELSHDCPCHHEPRTKKSIGGLTATTVNGTEVSYKTALTHFVSKETIEPSGRIESSTRQTIAHSARPIPQEYPTLPAYSAQEPESSYINYGQTHVFQHQPLNTDGYLNANADRHGFVEAVRRPPSHDELLLAASSGIYDSIQPRQSICNKIHRAYKVLLLKFLLRF
jgi:hypothetical protein